MHGGYIVSTQRWIVSRPVSFGIKSAAILGFASPSCVKPWVIIIHNYPWLNFNIASTHRIHRASCDSSFLRLGNVVYITS